MKNTDIIKNIGKNIQKARLKKGFTQQYLAEQCNVSTKYISCIETGKSSGSVILILDICNILDVSPNYLLNKTKKDNLEILPLETSLTYLKLCDENKNFINNAIAHLYAMQKKR